LVINIREMLPQSPHYHNTFAISFGPMLHFILFYFFLSFGSQMRW